MSVEIKTPMLPESVSEATLLAWHKEVGESCQRDELLVEIETEKIVLEVPAPSDGNLIEIIKSPGETIYEQDILAIFGTSNSKAGAAPEEQQSPPEPAEQALASPEEDKSTEPILSPAARQLSGESGIDPSTISGTGKDGRITKADVMQLVKEPPVPKLEKPKPAVPKPSPPLAPAEPAKPIAVAEGEVERFVRREPMSRIRRTIADRLVQAQHTAALLTTFNEVDLSAVIELRKKYRDEFESTHGARLGFMSFFVKAATQSLQAMPAVNAIIDGDDIVYHNYCDVGIAVSSPRGLVVPVLRNAEKLGFAEIELQIRDFAARAQARSLKLEELTGGTFTITNGGVFGSLVSTPIVSPPQSAILGMHKIQQRPVAVDGNVVIRPMMYLALTYDHRIIDGREAVGFLVGIKEALEDPARMLLRL